MSRAKIRFAPLPDPRQQTDDDESETDLSAPFPPSSDTASDISTSISPPSTSALPTPQHHTTPRLPFWAFSKKKYSGDSQSSSASSSMHSLTPTQSLTGPVSFSTPRLLSMFRGGEKENGHPLSRWSSPGSTTSADAGLWRSQSTQSYVPKQQRKGRAPPPRKTDGLLATIHTPNPAKGTRMLNGRVYGQKKAQRERNLFATAPDAEPEFVEWGYGGMGSVKSSREAGGKMWGKLQSEARDDDDDGGGMAWVKKRREERERKAREEREAKEKEEREAREKEKEREALSLPSPPTSPSSSLTPTGHPTCSAISPDDSEHNLRAVTLPAAFVMRQEQSTDADGEDDDSDNEEYSEGEEESEDDEAARKTVLGAGVEKISRHKVST
ncbi:uncharacterized protein BT62DRAFT_1070684 [Guyanagaster necrorhizus]|uniref:Uncharacterized protein n=1 Tax=Guyanagaster necrorhizus TaxID=856835 RepID=A0A9P7W5I5_9AGAR|nr:uncharacterized protein BT62DRAFT_1070684 [Guyanagaster necrorhizus MCA 3950]KAG7452987.1 hypothetical protein BT62DRAFT_1070684 [Guyanagaster necrorhizus MCA 3950]